MRVFHNVKDTNSTGITGRPKMKPRAAAQPTTAAKAVRSEAGVMDKTSIESDNLLEKEKEKSKEELREQLKANKEDTTQAARDREQEAAETAATTANNSSGQGPRISRRPRNEEEKSPGGSTLLYRCTKK